MSPRADDVNGGTNDHQGCPEISIDADDEAREDAKDAADDDR